MRSSIRVKELEEDGYEALDVARGTNWSPAVFVNICLVEITMASERIQEIWQDTAVDSRGYKII